MSLKAWSYEKLGTEKSEKQKEREEEMSEKQREKRWWEESDCVRLRDGEWQREKTYLLRIEMEDVVLHVVLLPNENFRWDEVVRVRKRSSTSVFCPRRSRSSGCRRRSWSSGRQRYEPWRARVRVRFLPQLVLFVPSSAFNVFMGL